LIDKLLELVRKELDNIVLSNCYYICKETSIEEVMSEINSAFKATQGEGKEIVELSPCSSCIIKELVSYLNTKTYMALSPSGSTIEFYDLKSVIIEIEGEENSMALIIPKELMNERLNELRMQAMITIDDEENIKKILDID